MSEEQRSEIWQTNRMGHTEGHACLSEERQSEIRQTDWTEHADEFACLSEERYAKRCTHNDMYVIHEKQDSYDNCHCRDFSVDPRYKLTFTVVLNEEIHTCKLAKVKPLTVHDRVIFLHCVRNVNITLRRLQIIWPSFYLRRRTCLIGKTFGLCYYGTF